jgi:hypothetical protein
MKPQRYRPPTVWYASAMVDRPTLSRYDRTRNPCEMNHRAAFAANLPKPGTCLRALRFSLSMTPLLRHGERHE